MRGRGEGSDVHGMVDESYPRLNRQTTSLGWRPTCGCGAEPVPATMLDCFLGSGTTALVARRLGRRCVGIELNPHYCEMAKQRLRQLSLLAPASP